MTESTSVIGEEGKDRADGKGTWWQFWKMEISVLLIVVLAREAYTHIKSCKVMYLKLGRFIVYLIFDWVCGMKNRKEKGRVEEEWAPFAVNPGLQLALPPVREEQGGVQIEFGRHSAWFVVAYDAGNYKQCWIGYKSLEEALLCFSYVLWAFCQKISCCPSLNL